MAVYELGLVFAGIALLGAAILPRILSDEPLSYPILYVLFGAAIFALPLDVPAPDPMEQSTLAVHLTELAVIVALMSAGLKIDRPFDVGEWSVTWRLLAVTMPVTIGAIALLGWGVAGLLPPAAILLGAVLAPTDPVLASDVQVGPPLDADGEGEQGDADGAREGTDERREGEDSTEPVRPTSSEGEVRFALTSEAGLNDGLAFPFTYAAVAIASVGLAPSAWFGEWIAVDVVYRIVVGVVVGFGLGRAFARVVFHRPSTTVLAQAMEGAEALAATLITYGIAELVGGYGFIAVFVSALALREYERAHDYHRKLHEFAVISERVLTAAVLVLFGGAVGGGLLAPLTLELVALGLAFLFVVRPLAGLLGLAGFSATLGIRSIISFFGIRGVGSFFYLSYALEEVAFPDAEVLWALVGFVVLASVVVHGVAASPTMGLLDWYRE